MDVETARGLPKVLLHDHLDGGLRPATILELADEVGYDGLPTTDLEALEAWFFQGRSGSLERYLEAFAHTVAVMQTPEALHRVAYEAGIDLHADGVVYAEVRFGPSLHTAGGLRREEVIEAVLAGFEDARRETGIELFTIVTALRHDTDSAAVVAAAAPFVDAGVVAFDLAGPEAGHPVDDHLPACLLARELGLGVTLHAGEGDGPRSIWQALAHGGAARIGHGVRIVEDTDFDGREIRRLGSLARRVRDHRVPLEVCLSSNLHTGVASTPEAHPLGALHRAGFVVTLNTDNRLMSGVTLSEEVTLAVETFGLDEADLGAFMVAALEAGFGPWPVRRRLRDEVVGPAYAS
ncbi:MAG TPA: adenosine deaminase [Actinobacteria bacterium]|nr:adenosine deaminase [Actinomycetota bacterium]